MSKFNAFLFIVGLATFSCTKTNELVVPIQDNFELEQPVHFPKPHYEFTNNTISKQGVELGKLLFFDKTLSVDSTISCGSCHHQEVAFSDFPKALSLGVNNLVGTRNSPALFNLIWYTNFMHDGGINHIEVMPFAPISNPVEMAADLADVIHRLNKNEYYRTQFKTVFNTDSITDKYLFYALVQYMGTLISAESKYDSVQTGNANFTLLEQQGYQLFKQHCNTCHTEPLFTNNGFENNGLYSEFTDFGRFLITLDSADMGKFKVPSLRNIELTAPYMHNGSMATLEQVLQHYTLGIQSSSTVSPLVKPENKGFQFTQEELTAITAFLHTLTDYSFITNSELSKP